MVEFHSVWYLYDTIDNDLGYSDHCRQGCKDNNGSPSRKYSSSTGCSCKPGPQRCAAGCISPDGTRPIKFGENCKCVDRRKSKWSCCAKLFARNFNLATYTLAHRLVEFRSESPSEPPYTCRGSKRTARCIDRAAQGTKIPQDFFYGGLLRDKGERVFRDPRVTSEPSQFHDYLKYVDKVSYNLRKNKEDILEVYLVSNWSIFTKPALAWCTYNLL
jgi:hypothetical protein